MSSIKVGGSQKVRRAEDEMREEELLEELVSVSIFITWKNLPLLWFTEKEVAGLLKVVWNF